MLLTLIRKLMKYGVLQIQVKEKQWFCQLAIRDPSGLIGAIVYERGTMLEAVLEKLLRQSEKEYKEILGRMQEGIQEDLDLW